MLNDWPAFEDGFVVHWFCFRSCCNEVQCRCDEKWPCWVWPFDCMARRWSQVMCDRHVHVMLYVQTDSGFFRHLQETVPVGTAFFRDGVRRVGMYNICCIDWPNVNVVKPARRMPEKCGMASCASCGWAGYRTFTRWSKRVLWRCMLFASRWFWRHDAQDTRPFWAKKMQW